LKIYLDNAEGHVLTKRITPYLLDYGISFTNNFHKADIHLCFVRSSGNFGIPIIQRIDGIYYDKNIDYNARNAAISETHTKAKGIVYQSEYCQKASERYLKPRRKDSITRIIFNGIDPYWCGEHIPQEHPQITITAKWRRHKRLKETIEVFQSFLKYYPKAVLHICGMLHDNPVPNHPNIIYYGHINHKQMHDIMRKTTMSIHLSRRDACPNSVVEALGAGIPVITTSDCGGSTEMCQMTSGCIIVHEDGDPNLVPVPHYTDEYNKLTKPLHNNLVEAMVNLAENPNRVELPEKLTAKHTALEYFNFFKDVL
jgi:glycosyltransferase involved in cell wall biosynthesis